MEGHGNFHGGYSWDTGNEADDADFEAKLQAVTGSQTYQTYPPLQGSVPTTADTYRYGQNGGCYPPTLLHNNEGWTRDGALGNGDYTNDSSTSSLRRSRLSAPQRIRTRVGNETLESPHYISHTQYIGYPTQNLPKGNSQWVAASPHITADFQQKPVRYTTEHQRFRGNIPYNQTTPFQAAVNLGHGNQKSGEMLSPRREQDVHRDSPATQALGYPQPSSMQHLVARRIRVSASSTLTNSTTASGSTGGTFSSVSAREEGSLLDAPQPSNLGYQLSQLQIADNTVDVDGNSQTMQPSRSSHGVHVYASASYGQVPAMMAAQPISQQDACSHCHALLTVTPVISPLTMGTMPPLEWSELDIVQKVAVTGAQAVEDHFLEHAICSSISEGYTGRIFHGEPNLEVGSSTKDIILTCWWHMQSRDPES
ncbi:hypothetical protein EV426DRAFT_709233 [Tirmania nivea]|nr:hypothetical protein EV426DRAFT_709233 [Tirmania nivea]